jgi:DNA invertase Pin-like site-specific DNA recombinase
LTTWIKKALDQIVRVDDMVAKIEDRLHRARASAAQYATTPDGRWMGLGHTGSYPFMDADQLKTFREKEAAALAKGLINAVRPYPT